MLSGTFSVARLSIMRSRIAMASGFCTAFPDASITGLLPSLPSSSMYFSCSVVGNECWRYCISTSRGVRSSSSRVCPVSLAWASRRFIVASSVLTNCMMTELPASSCRFASASSDGADSAVSTVLKNRWCAPQNADSAELRACESFLEPDDSIAASTLDSVICHACASSS